jgi:hypothetical protein
MVDTLLDDRSPAKIYHNNYRYVYKDFVILIQNLKIERTTPLKTGVKSGAPEGLAVPAPPVVK